MFTTRYYLISASVIVTVLFFPSVLAAGSTLNIPDRRTAIDTVRGQVDTTREAVLRKQFQENLDAYMVMRGLRSPSGAEDQDTYWFDSDEDIPPELLCLPNTQLRAPIMGRGEARQGRPLVDLPNDRSASPRVLFSPQLEELFRVIVATTLGPIDQARVLRVVPLFPEGVPVQLVSDALFMALPRLPVGLEYRFREHDLLVVDLDRNRVVDEIWLVIGPSRT